MSELAPGTAGMCTRNWQAKSSSLLSPALSLPKNSAREAGQLRPPVRQDEDVLRPHVPVDHLLPVGVVQGLPDLGDDLSSEAPKHDPRYYFRPFKTILVRTVADGGESYYVRGDHAATVPALYDAIVERC